MKHKYIDINLADIPKSPGVYIFLSSSGKAIYVGKAKSLRQRLSSYFNATVKRIKTERMLASAHGLKTIVTENEVEAFLLEANLIKTEMPKYNILLKDSKGYPYVKITGEEYPRLIFTRRTDDEKASYFGPFVNVGDLKHIIELLQNSFPLRTCNNFRFNEGKICLKYQIKKCPGPCENLISRQDYMKIADSIRRFFKGEVKEVKEKFYEQMQYYSKKLAFEEAAGIRDRLASLDKLFSHQSVSNVDDERSIDFFYKHTISGVTGITQLFIRNGKMIGVSTHFFAEEEDELLERFIMQFYTNVRQFPQLIAAEGGEYEENMIEALSHMAGRKIYVKKRGLKGLEQLAAQNAEHCTEAYLKKVGERTDVSERLTKLVGLESISRVECVDISHLGGDYTVGVSVTSVNGEFAKNFYRKYKIKCAANDDFLSLYELFIRKGKNIKEGSEEEADLYIIDGGTGQLNSVLRAAKESGFKASFISISKSRSLRSVKNDFEESIEEIHLPNRKNPVKFGKNDPLLHFIQRMRDESHRFAITYSRNLALKGMYKSPLLEVEGMGEKRLRQLLMSIPDIYARKNITAEYIHSETKLPMELAEKIIDFLKTETEKTLNLNKDRQIDR